MEILVLLIIAIAYVASTNKKISKLEKENLLLKKELATLKGNDEKIELDDNVAKAQEIKKVKTITNEERIQKAQESKNTGILITGAVLIVLSAIVFLTSTWNAIPNLIKTLVIILLSGVFLGASKIAKDKFNLEKTSNTFFFIAMAYVPICLISCSAFGLFGDYFSLYGPGNVIYLTFVAILTSIIYFINYKKRNSNGLLYGSMISQVSAVILFTLIFEYNTNLILINLLLYNVFLMLLSKNKSIGKIRFIKIMYSAIAYITGFITLFCLYEFTVEVLVILIFLALNFLLLYRKNRNNILNSYLFSIVLYLLGIYFSGITIYNETIKVAVEMCYIIFVYIIGRIVLKLNKDENLLKSIMLLGILSMSGVYLEIYGFNNIFISPVITAILLVVMSVISYMTVKENKLFKYCSYMSIMLFLYSCIDFLDLTQDMKLLIPAISTVGITILENNYPKLKDEFSKIFVIIMQIVGYSTLTLLGNNIGTVLTILFSAYLFYNNSKNKENDWLKIIPLIGVMPKLFFNQLDETTNIILRFGIVIALTVYTIYKKKISITTVFSGIYLFFTIADFENIYLAFSLVGIWSAVQYYFVESQKGKDIFKAILYYCITAIYLEFLDDFELDKYASFALIGITISAILYLKTIVSKYMKDSDWIEYLVLSIIYLWAIMAYNDEKDGMIYVLALVGLLIFSYNKKFGAIFIVTSLAIILNALALTREFWFSIPWWIYLLLIGSILIAFAMKNESDSKNGKIGVGKFIKKIKDNIEK